MHFARRRRQSRHFFPDEEGTIASKSNTISLPRAFCTAVFNWSLLNNLVAPCRSHIVHHTHSCMPMHIMHMHVTCGKTPQGFGVPEQPHRQVQVCNKVLKVFERNLCSCQLNVCIGHPRRILHGCPDEKYVVELVKVVAPKILKIQECRLPDQARQDHARSRPPRPPDKMYLDWSWTLLTRPAPVHRGPQPRHSVDGFFLLEQLVDGMKCRCLFVPSVGILVNVQQLLKREFLSPIPHCGVLYSGNPRLRVHAGVHQPAQQLWRKLVLE